MAQQQHSSRLILIITIIVAVVLVAAIWPLSMIGKGSAPVVAADEADARIQPVARLELARAAAPSADRKPRDGAAVYAAVCQACHATGAAGAPKAGDKAAWAPRIATGTAALVSSAINGKNAMPARGGAADLSDAEVKAAVEHLVGLSR